MEKLRTHKPHILVVGDLMLDHYLWGGINRISPEAPVAVVDIDKEEVTLGGAGNVINNLITLGAKVSVASVIGEDETGSELSIILKKVGVIDQALIVQTDRISSKKSRVIASNQQIIRYDKESKNNITQDSEIKIIKAIKEHLLAYDMIVLSDYGKGVLTSSLVQNIISLANEKNIKVLVDPKGSDYSKYKGAYLLTPNKKEAIESSGINIKDDKSLQKALQWFKKEINLQKSLITLSEDGIAILDDEFKKIPTVAKEVFDVTGAGDTVIASLAYALSANIALDEASKFANYAAAVVVGKIGSATTSLDEIEQYEREIHQSDSSAFIKSFEEIDRIVKNAKKQNKKIVFTNGCFDILHIGHVKYLQEAKSYGDILIIGVNSDASVRELKGSMRPINTQKDRAYLLAALEAVDYVVIFKEDTPYKLIKIIQPDILVKGGDYKDKEVVGSDIAKIVKLVDFIAGKSTTKTIEKIAQGDNIC